MADSVGSISLDLETNTSGFKSQMNNLANEAQGTVGNAFKNLGIMIGEAFAVKKLFDFGKNAIDLASNLTEVQNVVDVTFGSMSNQVNAWAETTMKAFGMSELSAKKYASTMGAMLKSMGLTQQQTYSMSTSMADLAADMASFYNLNQDDAFAKIRAGISGEVMPLKELGINMSEANLQAFALSEGITKSYKSMNQAEQTLLRYNYLMHVTKDAQGDFARTSGSWANQTRLLSQEWDKFSATIGTVFMNALLPAVKMLNVFMDKLNEAAEYFSQFVALVTGSKVQTQASNVANSAASANNALADSTSGIADASNSATSALNGTSAAAEKAAKAAKGLSGFDKLNTLSKSKDSGSTASLDAGAGGASLPNANLGQGIKTKLELDASAFKTGIAEVKKIIDETIEYVKTNFGPPFADAINKIKPQFAELGKTFKGIFGDVETLGAPLKKWFTGDFTVLVKTSIKSAGTIISGLLDSFNKVFKDIWNIVLLPMGKKLITDIIPFWTQYYTQVTKSTTTAFGVIKNAFDTLWKDGATPALKLLVKIWSGTWDNFLSIWKSKGPGIFAELNKAFKSTGDAFNSAWKNFLKPVWDAFMQNADNLWTKHLSPLIKEFGTFVATLATDALEIYNKVIAPIVGWVAKTFGPSFSSAFKLVTSLFSAFLGTIGDIAKNVLKVFTGITDFITGVFTGNWKKAWTGIKTIFSGIFGGFKSIVDGAITVIATIINYIAGAFATGWKKALNGIKNVFSTIFGAFKGIVNGAIGIFKTVIDFITGTFTGNWKKAWNGVKKVFTDIFNTFGGIIKGAINAIIDGINFLIGALNKIRVPEVKVPGLGKVGGWGFNISTIPRLATGGLVSAPTLAMVGDNLGARQDPEVISPLSKLKSMIDNSNGNGETVLVLKQILTALNNQKQDLTLKVGETEMAKVVIKVLNDYARQHGSLPLNI